MLHIAPTSRSIEQKKSYVDFGSIVVINKLNNDSIFNKIHPFVVDIFDAHSEPYTHLYHILNSNPPDSLSVCIGGDHSIGVSTVLSSLNKFGDDLLVIWFDAYTDLNTCGTSPHKNTNGMPVSYLLDIDDKWEGLCYSGKKLKPSQLVYVGLQRQSVGPEEIKFINKYSIKSYYSSDILGKGIQYVIDEILKDYPDKKIHLSFDIDSLNPIDTLSIMPLTEVRESIGGVQGSIGLTKDHIMTFVKAMKNTKNLKCLDVVEFNPSIGSMKDIKLTQDMCVEVIKSVF